MFALMLTIEEECSQEIHKKNEVLRNWRNISFRNKTIDFELSALYHLFSVKSA